MTTSAWLLIRIPRNPDATSMAGVLSVNGQVSLAEGATIAAVCDALIAKAPGTTPTLIFPLDGRHLIAGNVLDEATRRGWPFSRHVPPGQEEHLLDRNSADALPTLSADDAGSVLQDLLSAMGEAWNDDELGESMGIGRSALMLCLRHFGAWHAYTIMVLSNLFQACAGTGADDNIVEACGIVEYVLKQPRPESVPGAGSAIVKLDELAHRCVGVGNRELASRVFDAGIDIARQAFGESHDNYLTAKQRKAQAFGG
ncbi:MAG TPA: hypothetical protein VLB44_27765 [Kofleriaceae bacterium]|nr:hypothetical protein [Kofleriaceae bacterium]